MLLSVPIKPNDGGFDKLIDALENCPSITDPQTRKEIISFLGDISKQVGERDTVRTSVVSILKAFSGFPDQFDKLIDAIGVYDKNNNYFNNLIKVVSDIARQQQGSENRSTRTITLFENVEVNSNDRDEAFESLWSELCSILDAIDWKHIWEACSKIKEINKNDKEGYIKSLCFTKNYELLKQVFLNQYDRKLIIKLGESLNSDNEYIRLWLKQANHQLVTTRIEPDKKGIKDVFCFPPILLIIVDRLADGKDQDKWNVQGQFKTQDKQYGLSLSQSKQGIICDTFEEIPKIIKRYIEYVENDDKFYSDKMDELRLEVFLPFLEIQRNIDNWAVDEEENFIITKNRLFLRIKERISNRRNYRISLLRKGWTKIENFLQNNRSEISKISFGETAKKDKTYDIMEILEDTNVSNWTELIDYIEHNQIWCMNWKRTFPNNKSERIEFFRSILDSGIPIVFWNWDSIPQDRVELETNLTESLCLNDLNYRCKTLLENTWRLRRVAWGDRDETNRKQYPGYYLGMLLEDPEILPDDKPLQTIGAN